MGCYFENLLWYSDSFFYYGRISFSFIGSFIVMDESAAIFVFAFSVFLRSRGGEHLLFLMIISGHCLVEFVGE